MKIDIEFFPIKMVRRQALDGKDLVNGGKSKPRKILVRQEFFLVVY